LLPVRRELRRTRSPLRRRDLPGEIDPCRDPGTCEAAAQHRSGARGAGMSSRKGVIGATAAVVVLVVGALWAAGALDPSDGATSAVRSDPSILHEGEVLELADDGMTLVATDTTTRAERTLARCTDCAYVRRLEPSAGGRWLAHAGLTCHPRER